MGRKGVENCKLQFSNGGEGGCPKIVTSDVPTSELTTFLASPLINLQFGNGGGEAVCERLPGGGGKKIKNYHKMMKSNIVYKRDQKGTT